MSSDSFIPPLRELPVGRLELRAAHLRTEIARSERSPVGRPKMLVFAALGLAILAVLLATPAFGLGERIVHLFAAGNQRPPDLIQTFFKNNFGPTGVIPGKAREAIRLSIDGYGTKSLWVAPTRSGGYCTTFGCNPRRQRPVDVSMQVAGPNSKSATRSGSRDVHIFIDGATPLLDAARVTIRFEDGDSERVPLVRMPKPIQAGFFLYQLPKDRWEAGQRPASVAVERADGAVLARDTRIARYARDGLGKVFAPPPPAPAPRTTSFSDPTGDAGSALDITKLDVTEDASANPNWIGFEVTVAGSLNSAEDGPLVALDLDQNPDTGSAFYGTEVEIAMVGRGNGEAEPALYRAHGADFRRTRDPIVGWGFRPHGVEFLVKRSAIGLKPGAAFNLVAASVASHPDTAPDIGTFTYQPVAGTQPPPLGPDRRAPAVFAYDSNGVHGKGARLEYWVLEGRGKTRQVIRIFRGPRLLKTISTPLADANPFGVEESTWHLPPSVRGDLRFSVRSIDAAGNRSKPSSAMLLIR
jgi:hypothetical protein